MGMKEIIVRQGDVLLRKVADVDDTKLEVVARDKGRIVLAYGETTGHAHAIASEEATLLHDPETERRFLSVLAAAGVALTHEEHASVLLEQGTYEVIGQYEFQPEELRKVSD